jgi:CheY-like chemotaxis protein/HPt (histidine-containing phosphotransfer) domain-containing protein/two-component sensor histidine kinase
MNAVIGMAQMALREELPPAARDYINQIKSAGDSLLTIINDILDFSKIESGKMSINMAEYEPLSVVNDVANIIRTRIGNKNLELIVDFDPNIPYQIMGDSTRIKQIIMNLANNAVKFTKEGRVELKVGFERNSEHEILLKVSVSDTGIGIKEEDMGKLFQSFSQVDSKRNRNIEGTGLGLAISKQLVTLMNGKIGVESKYGEGSTFAFEVPQLLLKEAPSVTMKNDHEILAGIFTDNPYILESLKHVFEQLGAKSKTILLVDQLEELEGSGAEFLFVDQPMFGTPVQQFAENHPDITCVLMTGFQSQVEYAIPNLVVVTKPLFSLNVATILNHETFYRDFDPERNQSFDFIAPEAEILIVDDNEVNLTVAEGLIKPVQARVDTAMSGKEAIDKISVKHYDLIFMDHMMPELDGIETTHIIRRFHEEYNDVPIIALTANAMEETRSMFLVEGMNDFIAKPIEVKVISAKLRQWLPKDKIYHVSEEERKAAEEKAQETQNDSVLGQLQQTGLFDVKKAVSMLGTEDLYWTVLQDYYSVIDKKSALISVFYDTMDWKNYTIEVHALKSASRQIGANALADLAAEMEKAGNEKNYGFIMENQKRLLHMYEGCKIALAPFMKKEENEESGRKGTVTREELFAIFGELKAAISDLDMDGMENAVHRLTEYTYPEDQQALLVQMKEAVANLDVDACQDMLEQWEACY